MLIFSSIRNFIRKNWSKILNPKCNVIVQPQMSHKWPLNPIHIICQLPNRNWKYKETKWSDVLFRNAPLFFTVDEQYFLMVLVLDLLVYQVMMTTILWGVQDAARRRGGGGSGRERHVWLDGWLDGWLVGWRRNRQSFLQMTRLVGRLGSSLNNVSPGLSCKQSCRIYQPFCEIYSR